MDDRVGTRVGQQLGNYRLLHLLGQGGFAEVYVGEHRYLKAQAAIKVLRAQLPRQDLESFLTEARLIARLRHPSIVGVLEFGVENGTPFLVMDFAPNGTLKQRHPRGIPLPVATVVSYVKQVAEALQYAHDQKLVHRDVKPENMLLGPNNEVLLSDFGIAVIDQSSGDQRERIVGTVAYMAPEQLQGKPNPASDQYALGIVVYAWLTGDLPFHGAFVQVASQHILASPPSLREKVPTIPPAVEQVVLRALAKEPRQRFNSVQAFADALEQANQSGASVPLIPPSASDLSPAASSLGSKTLPVEQSLAPGSPLAPLSAKPQPRPGHFWKATALFSALVLLIIGGGLTYYTLALQPGQMHLQATNTAQAQRQQKATSIAYATATLQAKRKGTAISIASATVQAQATATALQTLYIQSTSGNPVLNDHLNVQDQYGWDEHDSPNRGACMFKGGTYDASAFQTGFQACLASNTNFSNFAFQVQVKSITGDAAVVYFRNTILNQVIQGYRFSISTSSSYKLDLTLNATQGRVLQVGISPAIHTQQGQSNEITIIAKGSAIYVYVNQQYITSVSDSTFSSGAIGLGAGYLTTPTEVAFSNARVWVL